ncbi:hypothetical protein NG99_06065, partial [Erwinia typographi]
MVITDSTGDITGEVADGDVTGITHPRIAGKAEPGSVIFIRNNGESIGVATADAEGNWSFEPEAMGEGMNLITTQVRTPDGYTVEGATASFFIDASLIINPEPQPQPEPQ